MHPTLALIVLWVAGVVVALGVVIAAIHWLFFDTSTGKEPDLDRVARSREYTAQHWSLEAAADHDRVCEEEFAGCHQPTRWRRLRAWLTRRRGA